MLAPPQLAWFGKTAPVPIYGRVAFIHCDNQPAVELFEAIRLQRGSVAKFLLAGCRGRSRHRLFSWNG